MTETTEPSGASASTASRGRGGLNAKLMPELKAIASGLGIKTAGMKKADLVGAITSAQAGGSSSGVERSARRDRQPAQDRAPADRSGGEPSEADGQAGEQAGERDGGRRRNRNGDQPTGSTTDAGRTNPGRNGSSSRADGDQPTGASGQPQQPDAKQAGRPDNKQDVKQSGRPDGKPDGKQDGKPDGKQDGKPDGKQDGKPDGKQDEQGDSQQPDDEQTGGRRNRRRRGRDRDRPQGGNNNPGSGGASGNNRGRNEPDTQILEDDVLTPCAGILDVLDNYAFVRTSGYLPGAEDVYVSLSMVRKLGLRRGDAITGQVRQPREGERKEKFNPLVAIDSVNGGDPEAARTRAEFDKLTPLHPSERLRMETEPGNLTGRIIDLVAPLGKGQRGLLVAPADAGKTMTLKSIAGSLTHNNPECHLMVVLVDERPEEVTDFARSVNGEVIASTFDRPATDHTTVAELAIERAKRLVELGHDVVVLLDGLTRLARAYNVSTPTSGRVLAGGVDAAALYPPKRFFGAARNLENGGSLTIVATAVVESGSQVDAVILEEFAGTANAELRLRGELADRRTYPAVDAVASGTRREELLLSEQELALVWKLRRVLASLEPEKALELLLERLRKTRTNHEFLMAVQKSSPQPGSD